MAQAKLFRAMASLGLLLVCHFMSCNLFADSIPALHIGFTEYVEERKALAHEIENYPGLSITDRRVLEAMATVPRHCFIPEELRAWAYLNNPLPIGYGQTISQPVIVASMSQLLNVSPGDRILEIGTGSGYQAAVLSELGALVFTVEIIPELGKRAEMLLHDLAYENIEVKIGDGYQGWIEHSPYDKIIVTCAPEKLPQPLIEQLSPTGTIVIPVGATNQTQYLLVYKFNKKGKLTRQYKYPVRFVPMTGEAQDEGK